MAEKPYTPRLTVDLPIPLHKRMQDLLPWGSTRPLVTALIEQAMDVIENVGPENAAVVIGAIISKKISIIDIMRNYEKTEDKK